MLRRLTFSGLFYSIFIVTAFAQQADWIRRADVNNVYTGAETVLGFYQDKAGNFYQVLNMQRNFGTTSPLNYFGTMVTVPDPARKYNLLARFDSTMNLLWARPFLCNSDITFAQTDVRENLTVDAAGSIYFADTDTTYKLTATGHLVWKKAFSAFAINTNKQGQLEFFQFKVAGNNLNGTPVSSGPGTTAVLDTAGNYVRHFTFNNPAYVSEIVFGRSKTGYYGLRVAVGWPAYKGPVRQEIFTCDSLGQITKTGLVNYNYYYNSGGFNSAIIQTLYDPVHEKYYLAGMFRRVDPVNRPDSATQKGQGLSIIQIDHNLQVSNILHLGARHMGTYANYYPFYMNTYNGSLYFAGNVDADFFTNKYFTHFGPLLKHGITNRRIILGKLDPNLNLAWFIPLGQGFMRRPMPAASGIYFSGVAMAFSNNYFNFPVTGFSTHDAFILKITDTGAASASLVGKIFRDLNQNGTDDNEPGVSGQATLNSNTGGLSYSAANGFFQVPAVPGLNTIRSVSLPKYWARTTPDSIQVNVSVQAAQPGGFNFGMYPVPGITDAAVSLTPVTAARINMPVAYQLSYHNLGTNVLNGTVKLVKAPELSYQSASVVPDAVSGDTLTWHYSNLHPQESRSLMLQFTLPNNPALNGRSLFSQATVTPLAGDTAKENNTAEVYHQVTGALAPNQITVTPSCPITPAFISAGKYLEYRIRFRNTGTDTAFSVVIKDSLSANLDLTSLEIIDQSHPATIWLQGNALVLHFGNIKLPHSAVNYAGSHGFFAYRIKVKPNTPAGTTIKNKAAIYFDFNDPVYTNEVITLVDPVNLPFTAATQPANCFGAATGQIMVSNNCGTAPVRYSLDSLTYQPSPVFTQLPVGNYSVWIKSGTDSFKLDSVRVLQPDSIKFTATPTHITCFGDSTGTITLNSNICIAAPVSYSTDSVTFQNSPVFSQLKAGIYTVFIRAGNQFHKLDSVEVQQPGPVNFTAAATPINCFGDSTGIITITSNICVAAPLRYSTDSITFQNTAIFPQLSAGNYTIWVKAGNLSFRLDSIRIQQPDSIHAVFSINNAVSGNGEITINTTGGAGPYLYSLNGGAAQTVGYFNNLPAGTYQVGIKDQHNCSKAYTVVIQNISGIKDHFLTGLNIYPNPFSDLLTIETTAAQEQARAQLFNPLGQLVLSQELAAGKTVLALEELPAGVYLIKVSTAKGYRTRTVIKN